ncbi:MAG: Smr/MutS family protein [Devosia nanyangense]|uniref:Smr/MutS family protein n=1 Tax=Devosia nanyangense TaxID=1228055 RepID=A0A933L270_9HYPH|nr:Smr/MutS family protein [Devosia nanyangense]
MPKRGGPKPPVPDFHLWQDVIGTVLPLKPRRRSAIAAPLPLPPATPPKPKASKIIAMPPYQSPNTPGKPPVGVIEPKLRQKLGRGRIGIDGTLDLHGMRQDEAHAALTRYLKARWARGDRTILVITGKGLKKVNGDPTTIVERGVLRTMLPIWLNSPELSPLVAGWDQSAQGHGGEGAWYVRLRRQERRP